MSDINEFVEIQSGADFGTVELIKNEKKLRGSVECYIEENGVMTLHHHNPNLIVRTGARALAHLISGRNETNFQIGSFQLGTGGNTPGDVNTPVAPTVSDTALNDTVSNFVKTFNPGTDTSFTPAGQETRVTFNLVVDTNEGNPPSGVRAYTEAGLFTRSGVLVARETFPAVNKTATRRIILRWTLLFD